MSKDRAFEGETATSAVSLNWATRFEVSATTGSTAAFLGAARALLPTANRAS